MLGETIQILCKHQVEDKSFVSWTFNGGPLPSNTKLIVTPSDLSFHLISFHSSNAGTYRCEVNDIINQIRFYDEAVLFEVGNTDEKYTIERNTFYVDPDLSRESKL